MKERDLQKDLEVCSTASKEPWTGVEIEEGKFNVLDAENDYVCTVHAKFMKDTVYDPFKEKQRISNKDFLLFARSALPYWLKEVETLRKKLSEVLACEEEVQVLCLKLTETDKIKKKTEILKTKLTEAVAREEEMKKVGQRLVVCAKAMQSVLEDWQAFAQVKPRNESFIKCNVENTVKVLNDDIETLLKTNLFGGGKMKIWTVGYRPFILGGKCNYLVGCEIEPDREVDLGNGYTGFEITSPSGNKIIAEKTSGAIVGTSLEQVRTDIATGDPEVMAKQVAEACKNTKEVEVVSTEEFWKLYEG